jgi:F-type H+-transporting ATPase subunit b
MEKLGINLGFLIFQILNFSVLVVLMYAFAYKPILNMLENRKQRIAQGFEDSRVAAEARSNAERDAENIINEAQSKAAQLVRDATERAEQVEREIRVEAENEAVKAREATLAEIDVERDRILGEVRSQVAALSIAAAQRLIGDTLDEQRQHLLINEFFSGIKSGKVAVLEGASLSGSSAQITSALPLTDDEKEILRNDVLTKLGEQATIAFRVDPNILGGLVIQVGGKVLDASVAGQLEELRQGLS